MSSAVDDTSATPSHTSKDDAALIQGAEKLFAVERLLNAAELLEQVEHKSLLQDRHHMMLHWAVAVRQGMEDLLKDPEDKTKAEENPWKKQSETHGHRDFLVYYQMTAQNQLISRIDCAIESSLLIPILAVFNESDLYSTWMPSWKKPIELGISKTRKLKESGRGNQIIQVTTSLAWPFYDRDLIMHVMAVDVIDEQQCIVIHAMSESHEDDPVIPEPVAKQIRIDFVCSILIRACPPEHLCLAKSKHEYPEGEELILFSLEMKADPHIGALPQSLQNFVTRTVIGRFWSSMMQVAEDVREGKRPAHMEAINEKRELYDWMDQRIAAMVQKLKEQNAGSSSTAKEAP